MACVNKRDSNFKKLISKYNATPGTVENAIKIYMDKNSLETYDPESQDFINHMDSYFKIRSSNIITSKSEYNRKHKVWEALNPTYSSSNEGKMKGIYSKLVELFGEENVIMYKTPTGEYIVRAAEPIFRSKAGIQSSKVDWAILSDNSYEVSSKGDKRFSASCAKFKKGTVIEGVDVSGMSIEDVYQKVVKKNGKEKIPSKDSKLHRTSVSNYTGNITPSADTIFVFGSNPEGKHGRKAAKVAREQFGAIYGQGEGLQGNSYALPTKDLRVKKNRGLRSIPKTKIIESIKKLYNTARQNPSKQFKIAYRNTDTATLSGYTGLEMIDMFLKAGSIPANIVFSKEWVDTGKFNLSKEELEDFSYSEDYLPLWQEWARQNPELIEELREKVKGKVLTDQFASTRVNQARALADILNSTENSNADIDAEPVLGTTSKIGKPESNSSNSTFTLNFKLEEVEFYSGAAIGSDKAWEAAATEAGIKVKNYTVKDWDKLTNEWKDKLDKEYREVVSILGRRALGVESYSGKLARRDMMQADKADAIFAIGTLASNGYVDEETGNATTRGIQRGIPVYLFDQSNNTWKVWSKEYAKFIPTNEPFLTKNAAVISTRELQDNGRKAIKSLIDNLSAQTQASENNTNKEITISYTPTGKSRQTYTIKGNKIFNKEGKEVFKTDSVDRNRIFANLAVKQGRAVVVSHKNKEYVVNNRNQIISVTTGKMMQWDENNGDRNAIIKAAQEKFKTTAQAQTSDNQQVPEENDNMQSAKVLVDKMIADSKKHIKFNPEDHSYTVDGKKADTSVTQFIHGVQDLGQWGTAASAIGTTADSVTRDFFKDELKDEYPNLSSKDLAFLKHDLKSLRNFFDKKFGKGKYTVVTEEFPIASKYTYTDSDGNLKEGVMAGTMDMLIYDNEGNFYIYDMKTSRSGLNENKVAGYAKQLSLYKSILEANYPELKGKIKELKLIQFRVGYPKPDSNFIYSENNGQLYLNNVPIQETEDYYAPHLDFTGNSLNNQVLVPVESVDMNILFEGMTEDEIELMREETREPESTEFSQDEVDSQRDNLYGNPLLSASERTFLANNVMSLTSFMITHLQTSPKANTDYFGEQFSKYDFTKMSREEIISTIGITKFFEYIKEEYYNPKKRTDLIRNKSAIKKLRIAYNNWAALVKSAYAKLITLEGVTVVAARPNEISREDIETTFQEQLDTGELEEKEREYWQLGIRNISARSSLSGNIRRAFERLFAIDSNRNPIKDKFGFNFDTFVDSGIAINSILEWTRTATTVEEMEEILEEMKDSYPWLNSILNKIKKEPFRSQFFQNFRKDFTQYSIVTVERDEKGNRVYKTHIINTKGAEKSILDEITAYYNSGLMQNIIITADDVEGKGRVNVKKVEALKAEKDKIVVEIKDAYAAVLKTVYNDTLENSVPKITKLLNELGIRVDTKVVSNTILGRGRPNDINNSSVMKLLSEMSYIFDTLLSKTDSTSYNPLLKGEEKNIYGNYKSMVKLMSRYIQDSIESSSYENGKMHYSFVTPSYMGKLILNLKNAINNPDKFNSFIEDNYGSYRWFKEEDGSWNNAWLELISEDKDIRQGLEHKVQLSFDGTPYTDLSELGYTLSLMSEYFYDKGSKKKGPQWAWYRVPMLSNKPSSEFIRFRRYSGSEYKRKIKRGLKMVLNQEVLRFRAVLERSVNKDIEAISNFDISSKVLEKNPQIKAKLKAKEPLTHSDLVKNGKLITSSSGASFKFLEAFNQNIVEGDELGMMLIDKINGVKVNEASFDKLVNKAIDSYMDIIVSREISQWEDIGLFDTEEVKKDEITETRYKYISSLTRSYSTIKKELFGKEKKLSKEQKSKIMKTMESEAKANLEEYVWNDMFATINIIQLTATDLAYYMNIEDFQKRYAQVHSPAMRLNITARDSKDRLYSADGMERTIYISDNKVKSDIISNVEEIFDQKISSISDPSEKANMKMMKALIMESFKKINVADAQGYSSPTSYRKKMGMMGKWTEEMEEAYDRIKKGDFNVNDLGVVWQPLKPFVYSQIRKPGGSDALSEIKVPVQNKNSEYLLILADALMRGGKKQSKLTAIFDFMEESAYDGRETKFNPETNTYEVIKEGTYNGKGIDTVQFESSVKSGKSGVVDINKVDSYEEIKNVLNEATYINSDRTASSDNNGDRYNVNYIHTIPFEDYGIQQEVPAHLIDHRQLMGSQMRILSISDITPGTKFKIGDEIIERDELINEYQNLIKENIEHSFEQLCKEFNIKGTRLERNRALRDILQKAIEKDQRYGADLQRACSLDDNGEFIIPLSDPIQSIRIQQLVNSIIKNRINKQEVTGGPVVQASVFGMSDDLSIRFKDKDGNLIETYNEFVEKRGLSKDESSAAEYKKFIDGKQASVAYFECYMPIPSSELEEALTRYDKNGHPYIISMEEAVKEGIIPEEMRKAIGYRI